MKISGLMPVRNGAAFLPSLIPSVLEGLDSQDELVVVNDNSSDQTLDILKSFAASDNRLRILINQRSGLVNALNLGLAEANFEWIARIDADDTYSSDRFTVQRKLFSDSVAAIFSDYDIQDMDDKHFGTIHSAVFAPAVSISLANPQRTAHPSVIFNRQKAIEAGAYQSEDFPAEDLSLWLRMSRLGSLVSAPAALLQYRLNPKGVTGQRRFEMLKKTQSLLETVQVNPADILLAEENFTEILQGYNNLPHGGLRSALFFRDLLKSNNLYASGLNTRRLISDFAPFLIRYPSLFPDLANQFYYKIYRKIER